MNDPNGMVFHEGVYHLFFQYHPHSSVWGPMHWGHATSRDLLHWQEHDIALAPDELGMIFSGSAVFDAHNTSGLAISGRAPLVAIFTHSQPSAEALGAPHQHQSLAYSVDAGKTWQKYAGNPVLESPGLKDFRDPKVFWHEATGRWVMGVACGDHIAFYTSLDLKNWALKSSFGHTAGAHEGVWECPDLVALMLNGRERWVLLVSVTLGGPQKGSATQYFVGDFDGQVFTAEHTDTRWLDWGPDNYAGVTWSNTPGRSVFMGWMSNWLYAAKLPTAPWRGAMTLPRELQLREVNGCAWLCVPVIDEVDQAFRMSTGVQGGAMPDLLQAFENAQGRCRLTLRAQASQSWSLQLMNACGDVWRLSYQPQERQFSVDRTMSGESTFHPDFAACHRVPRIGQSPEIDVQIYLDASCLETIADGGLTSISSLVFPNQPWTTWVTQGEALVSLQTL